jgi:hypothetical protein
MCALVRVFGTCTFSFMCACMLHAAYCACVHIKATLPRLKCTSHGSNVLVYACMYIEMLTYICTCIPCGPPQALVATCLTDSLSVCLSELYCKRFRICTCLGMHAFYVSAHTSICKDTCTCICIYLRDHYLRKHVYTGKTKNMG